MHAVMRIKNALFTFLEAVITVWLGCTSNTVIINKNVWWWCKLSVPVFSVITNTNTHIHILVLIFTMTPCTIAALISSFAKFMTVMMLLLCLIQGWKALVWRSGNLLLESSVAMIWLCKCICVRCRKMICCVLSDKTEFGTTT